MSVTAPARQTPETTAATAGDDQALPAAVDVVIIGSGFSGLAMAERLLRGGRTDFVLLERAGDIGGTWRDNSYPGCACDVPSHLYSFSWMPNPEWSSTFSPQAEIHAYIRRAAEARGLLPHVRYHAEMTDATWDEPTHRWAVTTVRGTISARILVAAAGALSEPSIPQLPGLDTFRGAVFHSATWDHSHDLTGERVAVVGTGASAIQFVPQIQPAVSSLHLFQRTPPWVMPRRARPLTPAERRVYRRLPRAQQLMREGIYWAREAYAVPLLRVGLARAARRVMLGHLRKQVADPALRARLTPDYLPGCKRILISNDYYPALTRPNVEVITQGVAAVREHSVVAADGTEREVDAIIFGTGFHVTDMPIAGRLRRADGRTMAEVWDEQGMAAYRGTTVAGFPNLFLLLGPNTGTGHTSVVVMAEAQAGYVMDALEEMRRHGAAAVDVTEAAQARWNESVQEQLEGTVWTAGGCRSWYQDRTGRNTTLWPSFTFNFTRGVRAFDPSSYRMLPAGRGAGASPERAA